MASSSPPPVTTYWPFLPMTMAGPGAWHMGSTRPDARGRVRGPRPSEEADREVEGPDVLPGAPVEVEAVVERQRADGGADAHARAQRVAERRVDVVRILPDVPGVEQGAGVPHV